MPQYGFGLGNLTLIPTTGDTTPVQVGVLRDCTLNVEFTSKELRGAYQFPLDVARGPGKVNGTAKSARIQSGMIAALLNVSSTSGQKAGIIDSTSWVGAPAIPATPFQITVDPPGAGTWYEDHGVYFVATDLPLTKVSSNPTTGQYSVSAGVYTFAAADTGLSVRIGYSYSVTTGRTTTLQNQLMGASIVFVLTLYNTFRSKDYGVRLPQVVFPKMNFAMKLEDYLEQDLAFDAFADSTGKVFDFFTNE